MEKPNTVPRFLCKYYVNNHYSEKALLNNEIYHSHLNSFNDPFEIIFPIKKFDYKRALFIDRKKAANKEINSTKEINQKIKKKYSKFVSGLIEQFGISCFSINPQHPLMWAHYANNHQGFCLIFDPYSDWEYFKKIDKIDYTSKPLNIDIRLGIAKVAEQIIDIIFNKSLEWKYEQEYRRLENSIGLHKYKTNSLKFIILGYKMVTTDKEKFSKIAKSKNPEVIVLETKLSSKKNTLKFFDYTTKERIKFKIGIDFKSGKNHNPEDMRCVKHMGIDCICPKCWGK
jgi:hypothetical protein